MKKHKLREQLAAERILRREAEASAEARAGSPTEFALRRENSLLHAELDAANRVIAEHQQHKQEAEAAWHRLDLRFDALFHGVADALLGGLGETDRERAEERLIAKIARRREVRADSHRNAGAIVDAFADSED